MLFSSSAARVLVKVLANLFLPTLEKIRLQLTLFISFVSAVINILPILKQFPETSLYCLAVQSISSSVYVLTIWSVHITTEECFCYEVEGELFTIKKCYSYYRKSLRHVLKYFIRFMIGS